MQDFGELAAPQILVPPHDQPAQFASAWDNYGSEQFLNYGRLPGDLFMINWPQCGNDYGEGVGRLIASPLSRHQFLQEARWHTQSFARYIQTQLGRRYGLANHIFPCSPTPPAPLSLGGGAYAMHPYYRESRRLIGITTIREQDILPTAESRVAPLPHNPAGFVSAIAIGNYVNDHHYPSIHFP
jgi:hypothetical protein